jgi:signal transduction histidine kinase
LDPALDDIINRLPLTVDLHVTHQRCPPSADNAYFTACEALANVVKRANANRARVTITVSNTYLFVKNLLGPSAVGDFRTDPPNGLAPTVTT